MIASFYVGGNALQLGVSAISLFFKNPKTLKDRYKLTGFDPYTMKTQVFIDGNKRAAIIYANHYLIAHGQGFLVIPEVHVSEFKKLLVAYYEGEDPKRITDFLKTNCWKTF